MPKVFDAPLQLGNIPLINLLNEFRIWNNWIRSDQFTNQFLQKGKPGPIRSPLLIWGGMPGDLFTLILGRTILGAESYIPAAAWIELGKSGRLTNELNSAVRNPFSIKPRQKGTAHCYYNAVPSLFDPKYALEQANPLLWEDVEEFYKKVRNKILHGYQIGARQPQVLYPSFDMFKSIYEWVHSWHDPSISFGRAKSGTP